MGRTLSTAIQNILANPVREINWAVDISFRESPGVFNFSSKPLTINGTAYANDIESIGDVRQSIESPIDRVPVKLQNKDGVLANHLSANFGLWKSAEARIRRSYKSGSEEALIEIFRGAVQSPGFDDLQFSFLVIPDTLTPGQIICNRTLAPPCPAPFKHPLLCGYSGDATLCNHLLKSPLGCEALENDHRFLGMEHRNDPDQRVPGEPGNPDDGEIRPPIRPICVRVDQYVRVRGQNGLSVAIKSAAVRAGDWIWHPVKRVFKRVRSAEIIENQPIWKVEAENGAIGYSSFRHPLISDERDFAGTAVEFLEFGERTLTEIDGVLYDSMLTESTDTGETGNVVWIEIDSDDPADKIYAYGEHPDRLLVCHNLKPFDTPVYF